MDEAIREVSGYGGQTPICKDKVESIEIACDRYSLMVANDWSTTLALKTAERPLEDEEKRYLNITDRLMQVAKLDNKNLLKPGTIVS